MPYCKSCRQNKAPDDFYVSNKSYCKECIKERTRLHRAENLYYYREYDRLRANNPNRVAARKAYAKTDAYRISHLKANEKYRIENSYISNARNITKRAVKQGRLKKRPCLICGSEQSEAHHFDYRLPENVIWLCDRHHKDVHKIAHEIDRQIEALENLREVAA